MFIYNVTTKVAPPIHEAWVQWMKEEHIPAVMSKGCFLEFRFAQLVDTDEEDGYTYTIQYTAKDRDQYERYIDLFADGLRKEIMKKWGNQVIAFRSLMQLVN